jgi:hypothetical protein
MNLLDILISYRQEVQERGREYANNWLFIQGKLLDGLLNCKSLLKNQWIVPVILLDIMVEKEL